MGKLPPPQEEIRKLPKFAVRSEASDLHLKVGYPPSIRIGGIVAKNTARVVDSCLRNC
jgi:Tfp pilus assembly pilus retraction ATPase PilT